MPIKTLLAILLVAVSAFADDPKPGDTEQLKAQIVALQKHVAAVEAQLALSNQNLEICALPEVMRVRLAAYDALQRAKPVETKPPAQPTK